jgi:hypothetical protein
MHGLLCLECLRACLQTQTLDQYILLSEALDECDEGLPRLTELISTSLARFNKVRWLVSSRSEVEVLAKLKNREISRVVDMDGGGLDGPIDMYIKHKLFTLNKNGTGYTEPILNKISDEVHRQAENVFLWVALVFKELESENGWNAVKTVKEMPLGLSELYDRMMTKIGEQWGKDTKDLQSCINVLATISLAYRPLLLSEIALLAGLDPGIDQQTIIKKCGSFLIIKENTVQLIHKSAKDYLQSTYKSKLQ